MKTNIPIPEKFTAKEIKRVAFFGSADISPESELYKEVFEIAQLIAKSGKIIVNGGGPGVMQAATRGAESVKGSSVAVTFQPKDMTEFEGRDSENRVDIEYQTANYIERMFGLIYYADLFICFQGGTGTLSEWATAWLMSHLYYGNHKPIILYGEFWYEVMDTITKHFFIDNKEENIYKIVTSKQELIEAIGQFELELTAKS